MSEVARMIAMPHGVTDPRTDPTQVRFRGTTVHRNMDFDMPFMSKVDDGLWLGGCVSQPQGRLLLPKFVKHVVCLIDFDRYDIQHNLRSYMVYALQDSLDQQLDRVDALARWVNECRADAPTLVHCQAGLNRSGLVVARALILDDVAPAEAISRLRSLRSPAVLCNPAFEEWLLRDVSPYGVCGCGQEMDEHGCPYGH